MIQVLFVKYARSLLISFITPEPNAIIMSHLASQCIKSDPRAFSSGSSLLSGKTCFDVGMPAASRTFTIFSPPIGQVFTSAMTNARDAPYFLTSVGRSLIAPLLMQVSLTQPNSNSAAPKLGKWQFFLYVSSYFILYLLFLYLLYFLKSF